MQPTSLISSCRNIWNVYYEWWMWLGVLHQYLCFIQPN